jgi:hypothetical protein
MRKHFKLVVPSTNMESCFFGLEREKGGGEGRKGGKRGGMEIERRGRLSKQHNLMLVHFIQQWMRKQLSIQTALSC